MDRPTITINGKIIDMLAPKASLWRKAVKLSQQRDKIPAADFVDQHCEIIAQAFGVPIEEILENVEVADVMPIFYDVLAYIMKRLWAKMIVDKKNAQETVDVQA